MKKIMLGLLLLNFFSTNLSLASDVKIYEEMISGKAVILDVREKDEIKSGMIKGATWLPLSSLKTNPTETIKKLKQIVKNKDLYIYCRSGQRAKTFITQVSAEGIKGINVGGYIDLVSQGLPSD